MTWFVACSGESDNLIWRVKVSRPCTQGLVFGQTKTLLSPVGAGIIKSGVFNNNNTVFIREFRGGVGVGFSGSSPFSLWGPRKLFANLLTVGCKVVSLFFVGGFLALLTDLLAAGYKVDSLLFVVGGSALLTNLHLGITG